MNTVCHATRAGHEWLCDTRGPFFSEALCPTAAMLVFRVQNSFPVPISVNIEEES